MTAQPRLPTERRKTVEGSDFELEADLELLAMGFVGPERQGS